MQNERRYREVVLPHLDSAFNLARWLARNDQDAEDIVQEAFLRAYRFFDSFHGDDARPWIMGIVRNTFYTWYQQQRAQRQSTQFDEDLHSGTAVDASAVQRSDDNPETLLLHKDAQRQFHRALSALPEEFREVLVMRELEDLSYKDIAGIVGIPVGTVMSRLARGRKRLAQVLGASDRTHDGT